MSLPERLRSLVALGALCAGLAAAMPAHAQVAHGAIRVGDLVDYSGRTAILGRKYGQGKTDAVRYINDHGGVNGLMIDLLTVDYAYVLPQAVNAYNSWMMNGGVAAIQGWGTADIRGLRELATRDHVPYFSASFDADRMAMTDEDDTGQTGTPYHFFVGPGAVDGVHALLQWAGEDWRRSGQDGPPIYVHMGDGSEFATIGRAPGEQRAMELGFEVHGALRYGTPEENAASCQALLDEGMDYAYLANTGETNARLIKTCREMGVSTRFMTNVWGFDSQMLQSLGMAGDGVVWVMATAAWGEDVPGMPLLKEIAAYAGSNEPKSIHYIQGVCAVYFMKDAMERAGYMRGGVTGENIRAAMYEQTRWSPLGLEGVCNPGTWAPDDHRGITDIWVYMAHVTDQGQRMERVHTASLPKPEPLGAPAATPVPEADH